MEIKSTQIGGKGTVRRKKCRTGNNFKQRPTKDDLNYKNKINRINTFIENITDNEKYDKFRIYLDTELEEVGLSIDKTDIKRAHKKDFNEVREDPLAYIYNILIQEIDKPLKFNINSYKIIKTKYEDDCIEIFMDFIRDIECVLEKEKYLERE
tara:strand:- start:625 stop:1083 length:459 start_codon:yes stop_codon:yes gene_type:complete